MHARVVICAVIQCDVWHVLTKRRMVPEIVLIELLQTRNVEECIERCPEVSVVAVVLAHCGVEHVVSHLDFIS